jgi:hypothetical protein
MGERALSILTHRRPEYLEQTLEALERCHGIEDWHVTLVLDEPDDSTLRLATRFTLDHGASMFIVISPTTEPYSRISEHTKFALTASFAHPSISFAAHLEEDCVPAQDFLEYMTWADTTYRADKNVFTACAWWGSDDLVRANIKNFSHDTLLHPHFTPWGWGIWKDRWEELKPRWSNEFWDRRLNEEVRGDRYSVFPKISRTKNIGLVGTQPTNEWIEREKKEKPLFAPDCAPGGWNGLA